MRSKPREDQNLSAGNLTNSDICKVSNLTLCKGSMLSDSALAPKYKKVPLSHGGPQLGSPPTIHLLGCYAAFDLANHSAAPSTSASDFGGRSPIGLP